jgi:hypothetical protein
MQHTQPAKYTGSSDIQKISSAHNIKGNFLLYSDSASVEDFTYVDYKKKFSQSISEIPTICTHRVAFAKSWLKRRLRNENPNKLGTRNCMEMGRATHASGDLRRVSTRQVGEFG